MLLEDRLDSSLGKVVNADEIIKFGPGKGVAIQHLAPRFNRNRHGGFIRILEGFDGEGVAPMGSLVCG